LLVVVALETLTSKDFDLEGIACEKQAEEIGLHIITVEYETAGAQVQVALFKAVLRRIEDADADRIKHVLSPIDVEKVEASVRQMRLANWKTAKSL
jgi:hypothetical protein